MARKRDGLVPIEEAISHLDGPVKKLRDATPQAVHHFTRFDQVNQLVEASEADPDMGFMARLLALCCLPRTNPGDRWKYVRRNGPYELIMISGGKTKLPYGSVVAWIGAETEFPLSQAVASGDAFEHRPSERGHCVQDFSTELDLRDLPGEAAEFEFGADDALPTAHLRFYSAALVVPCCRLPGHAPVAADLGNMAIPNGRITRRLQADHCVLWRWYDHIQGLPIPLPQQISCGRSIVGAVSQKARDRGIQLIQEAG